MKPPLECGKYYHIYNRGNNYENIFNENSDYKHFLNIYDVYISPIADTYAWCLMKNHFHILVRIKEEKEIGYLNSKNSKSEDPSIKWETYNVENPDKELIKKPVPIQQFKHLFNAYSRWFNIRHNRRGSLFEKNYERKLINNQKQFTNLIVYIHNNPVKHGFVEHTI
ncbi:MAG: transposase, partial [Bacteroidales bacterium]|nr:transposase [Bacteroidales bacterium]